jgi:DNA-binding CsgD family transcriptional regulator
VQLDLAQGRDTGAANRLGPLLDEARRRGFSATIGQSGWAPGLWRMLRDDVEVGALELMTWRDETSDSAGSMYTVHALLALDRIDEARAEIETDRPNFRPVITPYLMAVDALIARADGNLVAAEELAHEALSHQHQTGLRFFVAHTLEALAGIAAARESYVEFARLAGAAQALRDEMGYVLRYPYEQRVRNTDLPAARCALGDEAFDAAFAEGSALDEDAAVAYAQRARGERKRPTTGWQSLTPTETDIVRLVAEGLTNKQIGERLIMGAETVKTHLSHVYDKLGIHSRTALATELATLQQPTNGRRQR